MLEIYNETIRDLLIANGLGAAQSKLDVRQTSEGNVVAGLTGVFVFVSIYHLSLY